MFLQSLYTSYANSYNASDGLQTMFAYANDLTGGIFVPGLIFMFFCVIALGSFFSKLRLTGDGDMLGSLAASSFATTGLTVILTIGSGLVNLYTLVIVISVTIMFTWLLIFREDR